MWPFNKPPIKEVSVIQQKPTITKRLARRQSKVQVGVTTVEIQLKDGRTINTKIYGSVSQSIYDGYRCNKSYSNPTVSSLYITTSIEAAQRYISLLGSNMMSAGDVRSDIFLDDLRNPTMTLIGEPCGTKILGTEEYYEDFKESYLEDVEVLT